MKSTASEPGLRRISNNAIQTWLANNGRKNRCATDIAIHKSLVNNAGTIRCASDIASHNLMANKAGTIRWASDISIHKSMVNNVGTFGSGSDKLPSISCSTVLMGRLDAFLTLPFRSLAFNLAPSTRLVSKRLGSLDARLSNIAIQKLLMESIE